MNFSTSFRRSTAVVAGAFIGLAGAFALIAPASAHSGHLTGSATCVGDKLDVTWSLDTSYTNNSTAVISDYHNTPGGSQLHTLVDGGRIQGDVQNKTEDQTFDATKVTTAHLAFKLTWQDGNNWFHADVAADATPQTPCTTPPTTPPTTTPGGPTPILKQDCTTMTIGLSNPKEGKTITLDFVTKKGEERHDVIAPGETKTEKFSATPGFWVKVTPTGIEGGKPETVNYEQPSDCDTAGSGGGGLPVTGAAAGTIAGGAAVLLIAGGVLFMVARRRKVRFTA